MANNSFGNNSPATLEGYINYGLPDYNLLLNNLDSDLLTKINTPPNMPYGFNDTIYGGNLFDLLHLNNDQITKNVTAQTSAMRRAYMGLYGDPNSTDNNLRSDWANLNKDLQVGIYTNLNKDLQVGIYTNLNKDLQVGLYTNLNKDLQVGLYTNLNKDLQVGLYNNLTRRLQRRLRRTDEFKRTEGGASIIETRAQQRQQNWKDFGQGMGTFLKQGLETALASTGKAGEAVVGAIHIGDSIKNLVDINKSIKAGESVSGAAKLGGVSGVIGAVSDVANLFMPNRSEYEGKRGNITQTMDTAYDAIADAAMAFGPYGMAIGGLMKAGSFIGKGVGALGGGTDGMCVCAGTRVIKANGEICNIEDLKQEDGIIGWDGKLAAIESVSVLLDPTYKECVEIELENGTKLKCSIDHPILYTPKGRGREVRIDGKRKRIKQWVFKDAAKLEIGDKVGLINDVNIWGTEEMWEPYLVGLLIGDGTYEKHHGVKLSTGDYSTWKYIEDHHLGESIDPGSTIYSKEFRVYRIYDGPDNLRKLGIYNLVKEDKRLPNDIYKYSRDSICKLLAGLFDTDGSICFNEKTTDKRIVFYLSNLELILQVKELLVKLGIHGSIQHRKPSKSYINGREANSKESWAIVIKDKYSVINFYSNIKLNIDYKQANLELMYLYCLSGKSNDNRYLSGAKAEKVVGITYIGKLLVYNLLANVDHTYLASFIITHNTTTDAILGSSFFNLTPLGLLNGFGGSTTDTITKDEDAFATVGSSYSGTNRKVDKAVTMSGKKYGLLSRGAMKDANKLIAEATRLQNIMSGIAEEATNRRDLSTYMSSMYSNAYNMDLNGGYDQRYVAVGKLGMALTKARDLVQKIQQGTKVDDPFLKYLESLPENLKDSTNFRVKDYWEFNGKPKDFDEAVSKGMFTLQEDGWHANSVAENPETGDIEFMKSSDHPSIQKELDWYNSDDAAEFRNKYELKKTLPYYKYVKRKYEIKKLGGVLEEAIPEESELTPVNLEDINFDEIESYENGGEIVEESELTPVNLEDINFDEIESYENGGEIVEESELTPVNLEDINFDEIEFFKKGGKKEKKENIDDWIYSEEGTERLNELWESLQEERDSWPNWMNRADEEYLRTIKNGDDFSSHLLSYRTNSDGTTTIYPEILELDDHTLLKFNNDEAWGRALRTNDILQLPSERDAELFTRRYKELFKGFLNFQKAIEKDELFRKDNQIPTASPFVTDYMDKATKRQEFLESDIESFKNGGAMNVIPEGALHARKHNIDIDGITKKGIPVVSENENGEIEQQAEVECNEIILRLELTKKLEELGKKFYDNETSLKDKDDYALEAGKLLVEEILYNTIDNTNLINTV